MYRFVWALAFVVGCAFIFGCGTELRLDLGTANATPFAHAGTGGEFLVGTTVTLDGSASFDPDGTIRSYQWFVVKQPADSTARLVDPTNASSAFTLDTAGDYVVELSVSDDRGGLSSSTVSIRSLAPGLLVNAGPDFAIAWRGTAQLSGSVQVESGFTATVTWSFVSKPAGSTATLTGATTLGASFVADREGTFVVRLTAQTEHGSRSDDVVVAGIAARQLLNYALVDAEYSKALARYVIVSAGPATLHLHDPTSGNETAVALGFVPKAVGVSPDGLRAAVAHSGKVTIVNLQTMAVQTVYTLAVDVSDIVYGVDNRVHCIGEAGFAVTTLYTINLGNGQITSTASSYPDALAKARLHPGGNAMYTTQYGGSPTHLYRYDVSVSPVTYSRQWPYHGQYDAGYNFWFADDGTIIAASGQVFYSSTNDAVDMTYRATLPNEITVLWATHSVTAGSIAVLGVDYDTNFANILGYHVRTYSDQSLAVQQDITFPLTNTSYFSEGMFAAFNASGTTLYAITRSNTGSGTIYTLYPVLL
jgi:chitinase